MSFMVYVLIHKRLAPQSWLFNVLHEDTQMGLHVRYNHYTHALWQNAYPHTENNNKHLMGCTPSWSTWHSLAMTWRPGQWLNMSHSTVLELKLQEGCQHESDNYSTNRHEDLISAGRFKHFPRQYGFYLPSCMSIIKALCWTVPD